MIMILTIRYFSLACCLFIQALHLFTEYKLAGYWTDYIAGIAFFVAFLITIILKSFSNLSIKIASLTYIVFYSVWYLTVLGSFFDSPFFVDKFKTRSFLYLNVKDQLYNVYFKPVGAYAGGYGNLIIMECPNYFPIIEKPVHFIRCYTEDLKSDTFEGFPVDNREIVRQEIEEFTSSHSVKFKSD